MYTGKIFGIGFHKTGTTSLGAALKVLGYRVCGPVGVRDPDIGSRVESIALPLVPRFDAFQDNPWPLLYRRLDVDYPGSKFILTIRPAAEWIRSLERHFGGDSTPMRQWIYGVGDPTDAREIYLNRYNAHNQEVVEHFSARPDDLLVLRLTEGEGWEKLCPFLAAPTPDIPFPRTNTVLDRQGKTLRRRVTTFIRGLGR